VAELNGFGAWVLSCLTDVVKNGRVPFDLKNEAAKQLAVSIANLVDENNYLRAVLRVFTPEISATAEQVTIKFGPESQYALNLPVASTSDRNRMIAQLEATIAELKQSQPLDQSAQQLLFDPIAIR
jgi:hypothetical protein